MNLHRFTLDDAVKVGDTGNDIDFQYYATGSISAIIDAGNATFTLTGISVDTDKGIDVGSSGSKVSYTAGTPLVTLYATNAGTSGSTSAEPLLVHSTLTGAGQVGGRSKFYMTANVALGGWANALKAHTVFGASGSVTGLGSALCAELELSAGTSSGSYAAIEAELIAGSSASTGTKTAFIFCNADGTDEDTVDSNAFLFDFGDALDAASGKFIDTDITTHSAYGGIRVNIEGVGTKYIALVSD